MKRDIRLNMQEVHNVQEKIEEYADAIEQLESAAQTFRKVIAEQESEAYSKLEQIWTEEIIDSGHALKERLSTTSQVISEYINEIEAYIKPENETIEMRVDRNDIWYNCGQIEGKATAFEMMIFPLSNSFKDYKKLFIYNPFEDTESNEARKQKMLEEEEAERKKRENNYEKMEKIQQKLRAETRERITEYVAKIKSIHENNVIPFENADDDFAKKLDNYYDEWKDIGDFFSDIGTGVWDFLCGVFGAVKDLLIGLWDVCKALIWLGRKGTVMDSLGLIPESFEEDANNFVEGIKGIISDPANALEAMGQGIFDQADEKGGAYAVGYVASDLLLGKGIGKIGKAKTIARVVDTTTDATETLGKSLKVASKLDGIKYTDEVVDAVEDIGKIEKVKSPITAFDDVDDITDTVKNIEFESGSISVKGLEIIDGKVDGKIPIADYEKYRVASVHNPNSDTMTLGKYEPTIRPDGTKDFSVPGPGAYTVKAGDTTYFSLGTDWDKITDTYGLDAAGKNMFDYFNKPALDDAVNAGKEIRFSHDPEGYGECALKWEWDYLQDEHGYFALEKRGEFWYAIK